MEKEKILVVDDDESTCTLLKALLEKHQYRVIVATEGKQGLYLFEQEKPDLVVSDLKMPDISGIDLLKTIKKERPNTPVILITAYEDMESTIKAMQFGAYDFLEKPLDKAKLEFVINRAIETINLSKRLEIASSSLLIEEGKEDLIIGRTQKIKEILKKIGQVSSSKVNVLIQGESGTGKELISKVIHYSGVTRDYPFIAVNSAALPETLLESELFGHEKGSFTGAVKEKKGKFELAGQGTIFLDEISEISPNLQAKLLRVIQEREFERVGSERTIPMNARIIAATNRNLEEFIEKGKFREDLFYRLSVFSINVPPLRERKEDIPGLVVYFLNKINKDLHKNVRKIPYDVIDLLQNYEWVGNVRELENTLMQAVVLSKGEVLEKENILLRTENNNSIKHNLQDLSLASLEKEHIKYVLDLVNWDKKQAAKLLQVSRQTLYNKIKTYSILP